MQGILTLFFFQIAGPFDFSSCLVFLMHMNLDIVYDENQNELSFGSWKGVEY
jgi:hypothetical protein